VGIKGQKRFCSLKIPLKKCKKIYFTLYKVLNRKIMKYLLLFMLTFCCSTIFAQTQVGSDIEGEAIEDFSGESVSLSSDGTRMAIGAVFNDGNGVSSGHVRIFKEISGTWTQIGSDIDGEAAGDQSGGSVSLSSDGTRVAIGAYRNHEGGNFSGHVRIYEESGGIWTQLGNDIEGEAIEDFSGGSVSLSSNGTRVAIGAHQNDGNGSGNDFGQVRIYEESGGIWTQLGSDIDGEAAIDQSGGSVSLSSDGTRVAIGARFNDGTGTNAGHVRIYDESGGIWMQVGSDIDGEAINDGFGHSVSLSSDGTRVAIGAGGNDGNGSGAGHVRIYEESGGTWTQVGSDIDGEAANDFSGESVSLSSNGTRVAIGARGNDGNGNFSGHVRIYEESSGTWTQISNDIDGEVASDESGSAVSLSSDGTRVAIAAKRNHGGGSFSGHVRVFRDFVILPVELTQFEGQKTGEHINLRWQTASEQNNEGFEVQKSRTSTDWLSIDFVEGKGTTSEFNEYHYSDKKPYSGINYYRLKQMDHDGAFEYSKVISVLVETRQDLHVYPNPTTGILQVPDIDDGTYTITNYLGVQFKTGALNSHQINISELPKGMYLLQVIYKDGEFRKNTSIKIELK
jgi:hypothetical protein